MARPLAGLAGTWDVPWKCSLLSQAHVLRSRSPRMWLPQCAETLICLLDSEAQARASPKLRQEREAVSGSPRPVEPPDDSRRRPAPSSDRLSQPGCRLEETGGVPAGANGCGPSCAAAEAGGGTVCSLSHGPHHGIFSLERNTP